MIKKDLNIVIVDDSKVAYVTLKTMLMSIGFKSIKYFEYPLEYVNYLKHVKQDELDIVFIDYQMPVMNGLKVLYYTKFKFKDIITVMMTGSSDLKLKEKAIQYGVNEFMNKGIDFFEFKTKLNILANLRFYYYESKIQQKKLETLLEYKDTQEILAVQKQLKIIEDRISNHYYDEWLIDSFFKPKDILSGDSYSTLKISDEVFFVSIVDGMGKGISASLSSVLTVSFMNYSIKKSLEFDDFDFERVVKDTFKYATSIMLDNEALSFIMLEINLKQNTIKYVNFGMPPIYLTNKDNLIKIKPNNYPLLQSSTNFDIDLYEDNFDSILISSDGLFESLSEDGYPYFVRFKQHYNNVYLLSDLLKDFKANVSEADDDMSIVYMKKEDLIFKTVYKKEILLTQENIKNEVDTLENKILELPQRIRDKIIFSLNELLINCYEHTVLKISKNKHEIIQKDEKIEYNGKENFASLTILVSNEYAMVYLKDNGQGFDVSQILKSEWFNKYHGRGIKMLKKLTDGMYYNVTGNHVKLYFKL